MRKLVIDKTPPKVIRPEELREAVVTRLLNGVDSFAKLSSLCENISDILEAEKTNPPENERLSSLSRELTDYLRKYDSFGKSHKIMFPTQNEKAFVDQALRGDVDLAILIDKIATHFLGNASENKEVTDIRKDTSKKTQL